MQVIIYSHATQWQGAVMAPIIMRQQHAGAASVCKPNIELHHSEYMFTPTGSYMYSTLVAKKGILGCFVQMDALANHSFYKESNHSFCNYCLSMQIAFKVAV